MHVMYAPCIGNPTNHAFSCLQVHNNGLTLGTCNDAGVQFAHVPVGAGGRRHASVGPEVHHSQALGIVQSVPVGLHGATPLTQTPAYCYPTHPPPGPAATRV